MLLSEVLSITYSGSRKKQANTASTVHSSTRCSVRARALEADVEAGVEVDGEGREEEALMSRRSLSYCFERSSE